MIRKQVEHQRPMKHGHAAENVAFHGTQVKNKAGLEKPGMKSQLVEDVKRDKYFGPMKIHTAVAKKKN